MTKHPFVLGSWVSIACLALGVVSAHAQEPQHGPRKPGQEAVKPTNDARPGPMSERRGGPPELMPGGHLQPHPGGPPGEQMHENMERRKMHEMMHARDASVPPPFARMGDAGVGRRHHPVLTPEQIARRREQLAKLHTQFGNQVLGRPDVRKELSTHAWRVARLQRMRALAEEHKNSKLIERIDALMKKENERHEKRMDRLRGGDAGVLPVTHPRPAHSVNGQSKAGGQP